MEGAKLAAALTRVLGRGGAGTPVETPPAERGEAVAEAPPPGTAPVLIAEDNATNAFLLRKILQGIGVPSVRAADGVAAVRAFRRHRPRLVFMDVGMPNLDGPGATREIRRMEREMGWPPAAILGLTAHVGPDGRKACLDGGMDDHLTKPIDPEAIRSRVCRELATRSVSQTES